MNNVRQRPRVKINHVISCICHDGKDQYDPPCDGLIVNISIDGALIESQNPLSGQFLVLGNKSSTNPRLIKGEVVYTDTVISAEGSSFGMYRTGIKFTDLQENSKNFVISIVKPDVSKELTGQETSVSPLPDFDAQTINQILEDDTPTEELLRLDELFKDDNADEADYDVLETIAEVLEESGRSDAGTKEPGRLTVTQRKTGPQRLRKVTSAKTRFLLRFNAACFFLICFIGIVTTLYHHTDFFPELFFPSSTDTKIRLPFTGKPAAILKNEIEMVKPENRAYAALIPGSVKSRFVQTEGSEKQFIISGMINTVFIKSPPTIKLTGRLFNQNNFLLRKISQTATHPETPTQKKDSSDVKTIPFSIEFPNPPTDLSRFSIDIGI